MTRRRRTPRSIPALAGEPQLRVVLEGEISVYPRACGGTSLSGHEKCLGAGLSPRLRGNLSHQWEILACPRSIPALAGEPLPKNRLGKWNKVYPRACGGTLLAARPEAVASGLSPRLRGNLFPSLHREQSLRSIPALAGEPEPVEGERRVTGVYPRACGGTDDLTRADMTALGLSPRLRGNPLPKRLIWHAPRSIPALAGEPGIGGGSSGLGAVYPRACGGT